jgi:hypothetical protein
MEYQPNPARWATPTPKRQFRPGETGMITSASWAPYECHIQAANTPTASVALCGQVIPWRFVEAGRPFRVGSPQGNLVWVPEGVTCYACELRYAAAVYEPLNNAASPEWLEMAVKQAKARVGKAMHLSGRTGHRYIARLTRNAMEYLQWREDEVLAEYWVMAYRSASSFALRLAISDLKLNGRAPF